MSEASNPSTTGEAAETKHAEAEDLDEKNNDKTRVAVTFREDDGTILQELVDGTQIQINPDGIRLQLNPDGSIIQSRPDGVIIEAKPNGSRIQSFPDGCQIFSKSDGSVLQVNPDGTAFQTNTDGTIIQTLADRSKIEIPASAIVYSEPYSPLQPVAAGEMTTPRRRIKEALEIDRLIDDMYTDKAKDVSKHVPTNSTPSGQSSGNGKKKSAAERKAARKRRAAIRKRRNKRNGDNDSDALAAPTPAEVAPSPPKMLSNNIRVFVSSTFRDFGHERDFMMSKTLPILREMCFRKGLTITFVDLRWGVTSEESGRGDVIKLCLDEVDACRPFFICMLGERYGWHLTGEGDESLLETTFDIGAKHYPWVAEQRNRSVTEIEILGGALNPDIQDTKSGAILFYYREHEEFLKNTADKISPEDYPNYMPESPLAQERQTALKEEIKKVGYKPKKYSSIEYLSQLIIQDMKNAINVMFPSAPESITEVGRWQLQHKVFGSNLTIGFVPRPDVMDEINDHVDGGVPVLVVTGDSGCGKSALLAHWGEMHQNDNPKDVLITHFTGSTVQSTDHAHLVWRIMVGLKEALTIDFDFDSLHEESKMFEIFPTFLSTASTAAAKKGGKIVLILDAVNQLAERKNARELTWLHLIEGVTWIVSTHGGPTLRAVRRREWQEVLIEPMDEETRREVVRAALSVHGKKFDETQMDMVVTKPETGNPLFLRTVLDEARFFGNFFMLTQYLATLLESENTVELYGKVLDRLAGDCGRDLVDRSMAFVLASRDGMSDDELLWSMKVPRMGAFSTLLLAMREQLCTRSAFMTFFHDDARLAVERQVKEEMILAAHKRLVECFSRDIVTLRRKARELPVHLVKVGMWQELMDFICRGDVMAFMLDDESAKYEIGQYWRLLKTHLKVVPHKVLVAALDKVRAALEDGTLNEQEHRIGSDGAGVDDDEGQESHSRKKGKKNAVNKMEIAVSIMIGNVAVVLQMLGDYAVAAKLQEEAKDFFEKNYGPTHKRTANAYNNLGVLYQKTREFEKALTVGLKSLQISQETMGKTSAAVATALNNLGALYSEMGKSDIALKFYKKSLAIDEDKYGTDHPKVAITCNNLGAVYDALEDNDNAMKYYNRSLRIQEEKLGVDHAHIAFICNNLGLLHGRMGHSEIALSYYQRAMSIHEHRFGKNHPNVSSVCTNLAVLYQQQEEWELALQNFKRGMAIDEAHLSPDNVKIAIHCSNLGHYFVARGDFVSALSYYERAVAIFEKKFPDGENMQLAQAYDNAGDTCMHLEQYDEAEAYLLKAIAICEDLDDEQVSLLRNIAFLYTELKRFTEAKEYLLRALKLAEKLVGARSPELVPICNNLGAIHVGLDEMDMAVVYYKRALSILRDISAGSDGGMHHSAEYMSIIYNLGILLYNQRMYNDAKPYLEEVLDLQEKQLGPDNQETQATRELLENWPAV